jgi:hypothetical protein
MQKLRIAAAIRRQDRRLLIERASVFQSKFSAVPAFRDCLQPESSLTA